MRIAQNKIFKFIVIWLLGLLAVYALIGLPLVAGLFRGKDAYQALTYGYPNLRAQFKYHPLSCSIRKMLNQDSCKISLESSGVNLGVYDPDHGFDNKEKVAIDHYYFQWNDYANDEMLDELKQTSQKNRWALITIEPYPFEEKSALLEEVIDGVYDEVITTMCGDIHEYAQPVFVRWGHEMENVTGRYPWASQDSEGYIKAYKYFVDRCRSVADNVYYVWSPVGNKELVNYWPGKEYADYVGLSVYEYPEWDMHYFKKERSFDEILSEKYELVEGYDRPIMISEFGVTGSPEYQRSWLAAGAKLLSSFPMLKSIIYFNATDTEGVWGEDLATPDWSIDPEIFE